MNLSYFSQLVDIYCHFIKHDMYHSAIEGRDWEFIKIHIKATDKYIKHMRSTDVDAKLLLDKEIKTLINYRHEYEDKIYSMDSSCMLEKWKSKELNNIDSEDNVNLFESMHSFIFIYKKVVDFSKKNLPNSLNEYHNAFSHIVSLYFNEKSSSSNLKKAKSHLIRGVLDSAKYMIEYKKSLIMSNEQLLKDYRKIRTFELEEIGIMDDCASFNEGCNIVRMYTAFTNKLKNF